MLHKTIFVCIYSIFFLANTLKNSSAQEIQGVSGKYKGYNVILIILDALRPDHLSCYGYAKQTSPNIDELAKEGVLFKNAFSQASYTLPSVTSIFTSIYPYSHGVTHILKDKVPDKIGTLAQVLFGYGYDTAWFGVQDDPHSGRARGQLKGFNEKFQLLTTKGESMLKDNEIVFDWIKKPKRGSFFITIHSYSLHEQFFPKIRFFNKFYQAVPKDFLDSLDSQEKREWDYLLNMLQENPEKVNSVIGDELVKKYLTQPYRKGAVNELENLLKTDEQKMFLEEINRDVFIPFLKSLEGKSLAHILTLLDSAIYAVDNNLIGPLTRRLKENNLLDKTIIIITADHGNMYYEHQKFGHGSWLYDEVMRVPLIMYLPGFKKSAVISELAQSIDILPTALDLLGIEPSHQAQGISLVGLMEGRENALRNEYVFCQGIPEGSIAIRSKHWKLFRRAQETEKPQVRLFNLKNDPGEMKNVYKEKPQVARQLESCLEAWQKSLVIYRAAETDFAAGVDDATKERIKNTGYW